MSQAGYSYATIGQQHVTVDLTSCAACEKQDRACYLLDITCPSCGNKVARKHASIVLLLQRSTHLAWVYYATLVSRHRSYIVLPIHDGDLHPGAIAFARISYGTSLVANCLVICTVAAFEQLYAKPAIGIRLNAPALLTATIWLVCSTLPALLPLSRSSRNATSVEKTTVVLTAYVLLISSTLHSSR